MPNTITGTLLLENQLFGQFMALMYVLVILLWCIPFFFLLKLYSPLGSVRDREIVLISTILSVLATGQIIVFTNSLILIIPIIIIVASLVRKVKQK
jgi:heme A synthase